MTVESNSRSINGISAVIITKDAARSLAACLKSVAFCDEVLVVDSGSTDDTLAIARDTGARIVECAWRGFGPTKQFAVEQAAHDLIVSIDADEMVTDELRDAILALRSERAAGHTAWQVARRNRFMGRYLAHGEGYPDWCLRVFDRRHARWSDDLVHERVIVDGDAAPGRLGGDLLHDSVDSMESYVAKQNRYSTLAAEAAFARGKTSSAVQLFLSPLARFIRFYFVRRGFLDGVPGLVHILIGCQASFLKHAKSLALQAARKAAR